MRWAGHVACMGEEMRARFCCGSLKERDLKEDQIVDGSIMLKLILMEYD
jgi:hypothetical protein